MVMALVAKTGVYPQTQPEMNVAACEQLQKAADELNQAYNQVLATYEDDQEFVESLKKAQRAWVVFKDYHVASMFPKIKQGVYGSVKPMCRCDLLTELTNERTRVLRRWLAGIDEGDVCAGSIRSKRQLRH
jgi:uncharacterized protein YecT (DUF1311 family)